MDAHLRAGVAIHNAGGHRAAHDAWEAKWLDLATGTNDEQLLHGLIQFTVAVHHARTGNHRGSRKLAESAREYLADLPPAYQGVNVGEVREFLATLAENPEVVDEREPLQLYYEGDPLGFDDLDFAATAIVAPALADARGDDEAVVERAVSYARADLEADETGSPFVPLLFDYVRDPADRGIALQRLSEHVGRRRSRDEDVEGLFE
jgi:predicted metal-dependent hydrolase